MAKITREEERAQEEATRQAEEQAIDQEIEALPEIDRTTGKPIGGEEEEIETPPAAEDETPPHAEEEPPPGQQPRPSTKGKKEEKPPLPPVETTESEEEKFLNSIKPRNEKERVGFAALNGVIKTKNTKLGEQETTIKDLQKQLDELKGKLLPEEEVNRFRSLEEHARHTDVRKYNEIIFKPKLDKAANEAKELLAAAAPIAGISDKTLKIIEDRGGIIKFSQSNVHAGPSWKKDDGSPMTQADYFDQHIFKKLNRVQQGQLNRIIDRYSEAEIEMNSEIKKGEGNAKEYIETVQKKNWERFNSEANDELKTQINSLPKDWQRGIVEVPKDATPEDKARIERFNKAWESADKEFPQLLLMNAPRDRAKVAFRAIFSDFVKEENERLQRENAELLKRLEHLEKVKQSQSTNRLRSAPATQKPSQNGEIKDTMSDEEAVDAGL